MVNVGGLELRPRWLRISMGLMSTVNMNVDAVHSACPKAGLTIMSHWRWHSSVVLHLQQGGLQYFQWIMMISMCVYETLSWTHVCLVLVSMCTINSRATP